MQSANVGADWGFGQQQPIGGQTYYKGGLTAALPPAPADMVALRLWAFEHVTAHARLNGGYAEMRAVIKAASELETWARTGEVKA